MRTSKSNIVENLTLLVLHLRTVALVLLFIKFYYYYPVLAPNHDYCADSRLLSCENGPVIKYAKRNANQGSIVL